MQDFFTKNGFSVSQTNIEGGYDISRELEKLQNADAIVFQYPVFWMSMPWVAKKYFDEVLGAGSPEITYANDGRSRHDTSKRYGSGGCMKDKTYMLSMTYNCPKNEFDDTQGFFEGLSVDGANMHIHKIFQFCGLSPLKTFSMHDVFKSDLDMPFELKRLTDVLYKNFISVDGANK